MKLSELARVYDNVGTTRGEPARVRLLAGVLRDADAKTLEAVAHFTLGELVAPALSDRLGVGPGLIREALAAHSGRAAQEIDEAVRRTGDMGEVAARLAGGVDRLTVAELWKRANRAAERDEDRRALASYVFANTTGAGAKYFARMTLNQMRIGAGLGTLVKSIAAAFEVEAADVEHFYALTNDIGLAAASARRGVRALARQGPTLFRPYQFMNAHKVDDPAEIFAALEGRQVLFEVKYDGARLQIHLKNGRPAEVRLYSRRLNDDTASMPDVVAALRAAWRGGDAILEGEAVAFDPTLRRKLPFQTVLTRLGRKYDVEEKARETPFVLHLFDLVYHDGRDLMGEPQAERRRLLTTLFRTTDRVKMTEALVTDRPVRQERFFKRALRAGHEGLMAKDPDAAYTPGQRSESWMKIKPAFETLDVVVTGGIWGSGRRAGLLSSLIVSVRDRGGYKTVGKVGTGFSEETLRALTARLEPKIITARGHTVEIEPEVVIEVDFQDIQKTSRYAAGYVLRIPRFKRERTDKSTREADNLARLKRLYDQTH